MSASFHYSARREEEAKEGSSEAADAGFMGTGLSHLYAIPAGVAFGVPLIEFNWLVINEETLVRISVSFFESRSGKIFQVSDTFASFLLVQLASTFLAFCVVAYTQGGDAIAKSLRTKLMPCLKFKTRLRMK